MIPSRGIDPERLAEATAWAESRYHACDVCARRCGVDRHRGERGDCGLGVEGRVYKEYLHLGEERCLVPSHAIYMTGCNFRCVFCSDLGAVTAPLGRGSPVAPEALAARIAARRREGATNVNFVGGLPDVNLLYVLRTLAHCPLDTHVVWNTNLWTTPEAIEHLRGVVGTWLVDHKFGPGACASELAGIEDYFDTMARLIPLTRSGGALLVRHLLMPGHLTCCTEPVLDWLSRHVPDVGVNLMTGYQPFQLAGKRGAMGNRVPKEEVEQAVQALHASGLSAPMVDGVPV